MTYSSFEIFRTNLTLPIQTPSQELFGGMLSHIQMTSIMPLLIVLSFTLTVLLLCYPPKENRVWTTLSLTLASLLSVLLSIKFSSGWDELFINLKHSYALAHAGHYSYNIHNMMEGTVDFAPLFLTGLLGKLSLPLVESILCITLSGNILLILASWKIARAITQNPVGSLVAATGIGILPCVLYVGGTGFTATLFSAVILWSIYFLFFAENKRTAGVILLSMLTLIRTEGIIFGVLAWGYLCLNDRPFKFKRSLVSGTVIALPFLLSLALRQMAFGHAIPNPITFKNTAGNAAYLMAGMNQLVQSASFFFLPIFGLILVGPFLYCYRRKLIGLEILGALAITAMFCLLYYTGGGDWFPYMWSRYLMPFTVLLVLFSWSITQLFFCVIIKNSLVLRLLAILLIIAPFSSASNSAFRMVTWDIDAQTNRWDRIDSLGFFGRFLKMTTPANTVIASPEVATVMYFAERDLVDLLGIANPDIAYAPLDPLLPSDLLHRRHSPQTIRTHRPGILGFCGMDWMVKTDLRTKTDAEARNIIVQGFFTRYFKPMYNGFNSADLAFYRGGSDEYLKDLGYHRMLVSSPQATFYYLVHGSIYAEHVKRLKRLGFTSLGKGQVSYTLDPRLGALIDHAGF